MLPGFTHSRATNVVDGVRRLAVPGTRLHAGGTDLIGCLRDGVFTAKTLVSLSGLKELHGIGPAPGGGLRIGALTTHSEIAAHKAILESYRGLAGVALALVVRDGQVQRARVVFSGVAPVPWRSEPVERVITGKVLTPAVVAEAAEAGVKGAVALEKNGYKIPLLQGVVTEALLALA